MVAVNTTSVTLVGGGLMRLKAGARISTTSAQELELESGTVYIDIDPAHPHGTLSVRTPYGLVQHLGTQFEMTLLAAALRVRVREGAVRVIRSDLATASAGQEILLGATGIVQRRIIATDGPEWDWVQEPPSAFVAEGQPVLALVLWTGRETGRRLEFADDRTRQIAERTILHGSILGLSPNEALRAMLATTTLQAEVGPGVIRISPSPAGVAPSAH
jgi:ferric-dicitrate binding protein FerR (iron transport regulator)